MKVEEMLIVWKWIIKMNYEDADYALEFNEIWKGRYQLRNCIENVYCIGESFQG